MLGILGNAGPVGFDPTTTGFGGLCSVKSAPCPDWATDPARILDPCYLILNTCKQKLLLPYTASMYMQVKIINLIYEEVIGNNCTL